MDEKRKPYTLTLQPSVVSRALERAHCLGFKFSTYVNHILKTTEGMAGNADLPKKADVNEEDVTP